MKKCVRFSHCFLLRFVWSKNFFVGILVGIEFLSFVLVVILDCLIVKVNHKLFTTANFFLHHFSFLKHPYLKDYLQLIKLLLDTIYRQENWDLFDEANRLNFFQRFSFLFHFPRIDFLQRHNESSYSRARNFRTSARFICARALWPAIAIRRE